MRLFHSSYAESQITGSDTETRQKGKTDRRLHVWYVFLLVGVFATGGYFLLPSPAAQDTLRPLFNLAALGAAVAGILMHRPKRPLPWYLFTFSMLFFILGIVTYVYYENT